MFFKFQVGIVFLICRIGVTYTCIAHVRDNTPSASMLLDMIDCTSWGCQREDSILYTGGWGKGARGVLRGPHFRSPRLKSVPRWPSISGPCSKKGWGCKRKRCVQYMYKESNMKVACVRQDTICFTWPLLYDWRLLTFTRIFVLIY